MKKFIFLLASFLITTTLVLKAQAPVETKKADREAQKKEKVVVKEVEVIKDNKAEKDRSAQTGKDTDAAETTTPPVKDKSVVIDKSPDGKTVTVEKEVIKKKGPSQETIRKAEERSGGNAFSGQGKGGDKNMVDPINKKKKAKHEHKHMKKHEHKHEHKSSIEEGARKDSHLEKKVIEKKVIKD